MTRITKIFTIFLTATLTLTLLAGCHNSGQTATDEVDLAAIYDLNVDKITVWYLEGEIGLPEDTGGYTKAFEITDPTDVQKMIESVDFTSWEKPDGVGEGIPAYYIQFGDNAIISTYGESPYGDIAQGAFFQDGKLVANKDVKSHGPYDMPENLLTTLNEMIEKYRPDLITEE
ncbi:MAG: hypothetical protein ACOX05_01925 [Bacillota bacterium]